MTLTADAINRAADDPGLPDTSHDEGTQVDRAKDTFTRLRRSSGISTKVPSWIPGRDEAAHGAGPPQATCDLLRGFPFRSRRGDPLLGAHLSKWWQVSLGPKGMHALPPRGLIAPITFGLGDKNYITTSGGTWEQQIP